MDETKDLMSLIPEEFRADCETEVRAAKMICKSIDALTREIFLLRKNIFEGWKLAAEMKELDKGE